MLSNFVARAHVYVSRGTYQRALTRFRKKAVKHMYLTVPHACAADRARHAMLHTLGNGKHNATFFIEYSGLEFYYLAKTKTAV